MNKGKIIKNSFLYVMCSLMLRLFSLLLLPLYTAYLTPQDYGIVNLVSNFTSVANVIFAFALFYSIVRFYSEYKEDKEKVRRYFGTIITFVFLSGIAISALLFLFHGSIFPIILSSVNFYPTILIALISVTFGSLYFIYQYIMIAMENARKYTITSIAYFFIQLLFNILFIVYFRLGANGVILATLCTNVLLTIYMMIDLYAHRLIKLCIDRPILKDALKYSVPLLPHNLSTTISSYISKMFINNSYSLSSVGIFALASQFGAVADTIQSSVNTAFQPWFYNQLNKKEENYKESITNLSRLLIKILGLMLLGLALFSQEMIFLLSSQKFYKAWTVIPLMVISFSIKTTYYYYINILFYNKKATKFIFIATLSSSFLNIILSAILIPIFDMYGSVLADIICMVIRVGVIVYLSKFYEDVGYKLRVFLKHTLLEILFIGVGLILSYTLFIYQFSWINILYKFSIVVVYVIISFKPFSRESRKLLGSAINEIKAIIKKK